MRLRKAQLCLLFAAILVSSCHRRGDDDEGSPPWGDEEYRPRGPRGPQPQDCDASVSPEDAGTASPEDAGVPPPPPPPPPPPACTTTEGAIYLSEDLAICAAIQFTCPEGTERFDDDCGCGCVAPPPAPVCPEENDPSTVYLSHNTTLCSRLMITCPEGQETFNSDCGCGCVASAVTPPPGPTCPDAADPRVQYINEDPAICEAIDFVCPEACTRFDSECGCGCIQL